MSTNQETQSLDQTLNKTELGHVINENKKLIMVMAGIVLVAIMAYSYLSHQNHVAQQEQLNTIYKIESTVFNAYLEDKIKADKFKKSLLEIDQKLISAPNLIPAFMASLNKLEKEDQLDQEVMTTARDWTAKMDKKSDIFILASIRMAALLENQAQAVLALQLLEDLRATNPRIYQEKVYFELVRLYVSVQNLELAQQRYDYLMSNYPDSSFTKDAKLYLSGI